MLWRLRHKFFGTHFVLVDYGRFTYIRKVRTMPNGKKYIRCFLVVHWLDYAGLTQGEGLKAIGPNDYPRRCYPLT
jgi:hypothetical protein